MIRVSSIPTDLAPFSGYHAVQMAKRFGDKIFVIPNEGMYKTSSLNCYIPVCDKIGKKINLPLFFIRLISMVELYFFLLFRREKYIFVHNLLYSLPVFLTFRKYILIFHGSDIKFLSNFLFRYLSSKSQICYCIGSSKKIGSLFIKKIPNIFYPVKINYNLNKKKKLRILFVLRNHLVKNPLYPCRLFQSISVYSGLSFLITVVGLHKRFYKTKNNNQFISLGRLNIISLHKEYSKANIMIIPSYSEGISKTMLEGLSAGLPIIIDNALQIPVEFESFVKRTNLKNYKNVFSICKKLIKNNKKKSYIKFSLSYNKQALNKLIEIYGRFYNKN